MNKILNNKKILIMAGGTGGHIFPALSIAEYLLSKGMQVEWLGSKNSMEERVIGETNIPIHFISISGLRGKSLGKKLLSPFIIAWALMQSLIKVISIKPACVLGMGGFVTGPGGLAAWLLRKKLVIHEQNAIAGMTNQLLFPLASTVLEAFPGAFERKKAITNNSLVRSFIKSGKAIAVGNPVRAEFLECAEPTERFYSDVAINKNDKLKILIIGGSLGAVAINKIIPQLLSLYSIEARPEIVHQCGNRNLEETLADYNQLNITINESIKLVPFIKEMAKSYSWADLIICRAGAITISEIASVGLPSVLVPYPYAVDDHQTENAKILVDKKAGWLIPQDKLTAESLYEISTSLMKNKSRVSEMAMQARQASNDSATKIVAEYCMEACSA